MTVSQAKVSVPSRLPFFNFFDHQYRQSFGIRVTSGPAAFIATLPRPNRPLRLRFPKPAPLHNGPSSRAVRNPPPKSSTGDGSHSRPPERRQGSRSVACFNQSQSASVGRVAAYVQENARCVKDVEGMSDGLID